MMEECSFFCDNIWTWKEYCLVIIPIFMTLLSFGYGGYLRESVEDIIIVSFGVGVCSLAITAMLIFLPLVTSVGIGFIFLAYISWSIGKRL